MSGLSGGLAWLLGMPWATVPPVAVMVISAIWARYDARRLRMYDVYETHWIAILLMWPYTFPFYFAQRAKRRGPNLVPFAVLAVLLAFGGLAFGADDPSWTQR